MPGMAFGLLGLLTAVVAFLVGESWLAVPAGVWAAMAGVWCVILASSLRRTRADAAALVRRTARLEAESNRMASRAAQFESEMNKTRAELGDATRQEAARIAPGGVAAGSGPPAGRSPQSSTGDPATDAATGFFNERFFTATLEKRVSAARRGLRPLAVALIEVVSGVTGADDDQPRPSDPQFVAAALVETLREADTVARLRDGRFALLLEDTPENGAIWTLERFRRRIIDTQPGHTVWAGLSSYPAHAFDSAELMAQARVALGSAKEWRQDRIEVALIPDD